jgi:hypothetical protein
VYNEKNNGNTNCGCNCPFFFSFLYARLPVAPDAQSHLCAKIKDLCWCPCIIWVQSPCRPRVIIKNSRTTYGKKEFAIEAPYIQDRDTAYEMMGWMIQKIKKQKLAVSLELFAMPIIQLGDIVQIDYQSNNNRDIPSSTRFVVYCINHSVNEGDISQTVYLSEVV